MTTAQPVAGAAPEAPPERPPAVRRGSLAGLLVLAALLALAALVSLAVGALSIPLGTVVDVLFHNDGGEAATIVHGLRVPRTVLAIAVGAALGVAGALMQGHTRNPLAEPGLLGVSSGAAFAVVVGIFVFGVTDPRRTSRPGRRGRRPGPPSRRRR